MGNRTSKPSLDFTGNIYKKTKLNRHELTEWHKEFMKITKGTFGIDEDYFTNLYSEFFPFGDSKQLAKHVFRTFDQNKDGFISFDEYIYGISVMIKGTLAERLEWAFRFYDIDDDGFVSKSDFKDISQVVRDAMPQSKENKKTDIINIFSEDLQDNILGFDDFYDMSKKYPFIIQSLFIYDGLL